MTLPALVLTAGLATRLRPLSLLRAKAALPVAGEPLVSRILRQLAASGVTDAVLNLHHLPHTISGIVGDGEGLGVRVRYSWESPVLGSAGGPRRALPLLGAPAFLVVNGDTLNGIDLPELVEAHRRSAALLTMAVIPQQEPEKYGSVVADEKGVVSGLTPPHARTSAPPDRRTAAPSPPRTDLFHFLSVYVAEAAAFAALPDGEPSDFRQVVLAHPGRIRTHVVRPVDFFDIGTPADYLGTSLLLAQREGRSTHGADVRIAPAAKVTDSVLWDSVTVEDGAMVRECVVCDGVTVPADTSWYGVTLRRALGDPAPGEKRIGGLLVAAL